MEPLAMAYLKSELTYDFGRNIAAGEVKLATVWEMVNISSSTVDVDKIM